jgi:hypothetical protein
VKSFERNRDFSMSVKGNGLEWQFDVTAAWNAGHSVFRAASLKNRKPRWVQSFEIRREGKARNLRKKKTGMAGMWRVGTLLFTHEFPMGVFVSIVRFAVSLRPV